MDFTKEISDRFAGAPTELWKQFYALTQIPRPSTFEQKVSHYIGQLAESKGCQVALDEVGNVLVKVPPKGKFRKLSSAPTVIIQNHTDMVTDARPGKQIDFQNDPIEAFVDGDWLRAKDTTLGADNGIGCAAALALIELSEDQDVPALELLFTIDEERGLNGAKGLKPDWLKGKILLNLDTEDWGAAFVGCAGGLDLEFTKKLKTSSLPASCEYYQVSLAHLSGGHSGVDIHEQRSNSIVLLTSLLLDLPNSGDIYLTEFRAGKAHNIIPRDAVVTLAVTKGEKKNLDHALQTWDSRWRSSLNKEDQQFELKCEKVATPSGSVGVPQEVWRSLFAGINLFPHGPHSFIRDGGEKLKDLVQASCNLAKLLIVGEQFYIQSSLRHFRDFEQTLLIQKLKSFAELLQLEVIEGVGYPSWTPHFDSPLLHYTESVYRELFQDELNVRAIHAGLECGLLLDKYPQVMAISIGPTIKGAHSPDERVDIPSVTEFWKLLLAMLSKIDQLSD